MLTTKEAAVFLNVQPRTVVRNIQRGNLSAVKRGRDYFIERREIERFKRMRRKAGRPTK